MNATQTIFDLQMDNACDYLMKAEDILRFPAINRGPLVNASKTATACKPLVLPSLVHLFQVSAEEKKDKLFLPRTTWQFISPLDPKQETIQPSKPKGKPTNNQSAYYRKIWAFRQECMKQEAPASGTRSQPKDDTGPILFVNTGPLLGREAGQRNALPKHLVPKPPAGPRPKRNSRIAQVKLGLVGTKIGPMKESD
ncbi:hypothetical protein DPEC_G00198510 [Dallia pectoralis]|uniref:Uncharacterized protein n=1 Tax=Dallia pectoralis TaxID=75939 RepID=A0ACC2G7W1_DALPE|nr:hypothetical protein DPEC_G00198510 [Dallia pectoralis]